MSVIQLINTQAGILYIWLATLPTVAYTWSMPWLCFLLSVKDGQCSIISLYILYTGLCSVLFIAQCHIYLSQQMHIPAPGQNTLARNKCKLYSLLQSLSEIYNKDICGTGNMQGCWLYLWFHWRTPGGTIPVDDFVEGCQGAKNISHWHYISFTLMCAFKKVWGMIEFWFFWAPWSECCYFIWFWVDPFNDSSYSTSLNVKPLEKIKICHMTTDVKETFNFSAIHFLTWIEKPIFIYQVTHRLPLAVKL